MKTKSEIEQRIEDIDSEIYSFNYYSGFPFDKAHKLGAEKERLQYQLKALVAEVAA